MKKELIRQIKLGGEMSASQLSDVLGISRQMVHRILNDLVEENILQKIGKAPRTYYMLTEAKPEEGEKIEISNEEEDFLQKHFLFITEKGQRLEGLQAMKFWCARQKLPLLKTIQEFIRTRKKDLDFFGKNGLINGNQKIRSTKAFSQIGLDDLYYADFYAIERFGKTRLGNLIHFAKQGQNKSMMKEIVAWIKPLLLNLIKTENIEAVGYIPPTIKREVQIMKVFQTTLSIPLPHINLIKVKGNIVVPQKALSKIEDRIENARSSILVREVASYKRILLIDDAVGSGATINETALKIKERGIAKHIFGFAVTGSFKGFDVIQEV